MDEGLHLGGAVQVDVGHDPEIDGPVRVRRDDFDEVVVLLCRGLPQRTDAVALDHGAVPDQQAVGAQGNVLRRHVLLDPFQRPDAFGDLAPGAEAVLPEVGV